MSRDEREKYVQKKYGQRIHVCTINIITTQFLKVIILLIFVHLQTKVTQ